MKKKTDINDRLFSQKAAKEDMSWVKCGDKVDSINSVCDCCAGKRVWRDNGSILVCGECFTNQINRSRFFFFGRGHKASDSEW